MINDILDVQTCITDDLIRCEPCAWREIRWIDSCAFIDHQLRNTWKERWWMMIVLLLVRTSSVSGADLITTLTSTICHSTIGVNITINRCLSGLDLCSFVSSASFACAVPSVQQIDHNRIRWRLVMHWCVEHAEKTVSLHKRWVQHVQYMYQESQICSSNQEQTTHNYLLYMIVNAGGQRFSKHDVRSVNDESKHLWDDSRRRRRS